MACLPVPSGLQAPEALETDGDDLGLERGHHRLRVHRNDAKIVVVPLAPRTARTVDLAVGERNDGPVFVAEPTERMNRHQAARVIRRLATHAGIDKGSTRTR